MAACGGVRPLRVAVSLAFAGLTAAGIALAAAVLADEPPRRLIDASRVLDSGLLPEIHLTRTPPDPDPIVERGQWVFDLRWDRGDPWLLDVHRMELPAPQATPRVMGRFALELFEGPVLIERVRFDFPLLGPPVAADAGSAALSFSPKLRTQIGVIFPATARGTRLELWDRATGRRWTLPWPPGADAGGP